MLEEKEGRMNKLEIIMVLEFIGDHWTDFIYSCREKNMNAVSILEKLNKMKEG